MERLANNATTTLAAQLSSGATTLTVASAAAFPSAGNFRVRIDAELLLVTAVSGTTFTVTRGIEGTTAVLHSSGTAVKQVLTEDGLATFTNESIATALVGVPTDGDLTALQDAVDDVAADVAQVESDLEDLTTEVGTKAATSSLSTVATSGAYSDLTGKPTLGTAAALDAGTANGVASLDPSGLIPTAQLPPLAIVNVNTSISQAAMLGLTAQRGDICIRLDVLKTFILAADDPTTLANWKEITAAGHVTSVAGRTGTVALTKTDVGLSNLSNVDNTNAASLTSGTLATARLHATLQALIGNTIDGVTIGATTPVQAQARRPTNAQTGTSYTFVLGDAGKFVTFSNAAAQSATVPPNSSVAFPVDTEIDVAALGAGVVTITAGAGVTIRSLSSKVALAGQYAGATLKKLATDEWLLVGGLA